MKKIIALASLIIVGLFVTACGGSSATPTTTTATAMPSATESSDSADDSVDIATLLPSAPASADEWRYDSAQVVAQTGRPQLIEKWAED